jgi:hypothetical protein
MCAAANRPLDVAGLEQRRIGQLATVQPFGDGAPTDLIILLP